MDDKPPDTGKPSMITNGSLSAEIDPVPRTRIEGVTPTSDVSLETVRPVIAPCKADVISLTGALISFSPSNFEIEPVKWDFACVP